MNTHLDPNGSGKTDACGIGICNHVAPQELASLAPSRRRANRSAAERLEEGIEHGLSMEHNSSDVQLQNMHCLEQT